MKPVRKIDTVFFDVGGTIVRVQPSVGAVYADAAARHGFQADAAEVERGFRAAWKRSIERSRLRGFRTSDDILRAEWFEIVQDAFARRIPPPKVQAVFEDLYSQFVSADAWRLVPGVEKTLAYLRESGTRVGVLSNWDVRLRRMLVELGLGGAFDFIVISHEVGFEKPHGAIFKEALRLSGTDPDRTLHVGDSFHADILPARGFGMHTLWIASEEERRLEAEPGAGLDSFPGDPELFWSRLLSREAGTNSTLM